MYGVVVFCIYCVYFLCGTFPVGAIPPSYGTIAHVGVIIILTELFKIASMTCFFAVIFKVVDKRMPAFHVTLLATLYNLSYLVHKLYIYKLLEAFGIYWA
jgi:heme/copper-type cytochrome/quinol oxidase subunit 3